MNATLQDAPVRATPPRVSLMEMLRLALPMIIIQVGVVIMQFADAYMVKDLGDVALAAILPAGLLFFVPMAFGMGLLSAVNTFVSQCLGQKRPQECGHFAWQGVFIGIALGALLLPLWFVAVPLFAFFAHEPDVQKLEVIYYRISLLYMIPLMIGQAVSNFYVGVHRPWILAWVALTATFLNIFFNYVLIYGHFGFPAMGIAGAAWGTVLATTLQTVALMAHFLGSTKLREYGTHVIGFCKKDIVAMLRIGTPAGLQIGLEILIWGVALVWMVGMFGTDDLAATTIVVRYMHLSFMPPVGLSIALIAMVGKAIGQRDPELAKAYTAVAGKAVIAYMGALALFFYFNREWLISVFSTDPEVIRIGGMVFICVAIFQVFDAINIVYGHALRGAGDTFVPMVVSTFLCIAAFIGGGIYIIEFHNEWGSIGVWICGLIYMVLLGFFMWARWQFGPWRRIDIFKQD